MATSKELTDAVNALNSTINLEWEEDDVHHGVTRKRYTWTHRQANGAVKPERLDMAVWQDGGEQAAWYNRAPSDPTVAEEPRTAVSFVTTNLPDAAPETVKISRDGNVETVHVTIDSGTGAVKDGERRVYEITYDDAGDRTGIRRITNPSIGA